MKLQASVKNSLFDFFSNPQISKRINHLHTAVNQTGQTISPSNNKKGKFLDFSYPLNFDDHFFFFAKKYDST